MRNIKVLLGIGIALALILIVLAVLLFMGSGSNQQRGADSGDLFGDTSGTRTLATSTRNPFGELSTWTRAHAGEVGAKAPEFRAISNRPAIALVALEATIQGVPEEVVRFVDHTNGHILETPLATLAKPDILSPKTVLRIGEAQWSATGSSTLLQYLDDTSAVVYSFLGTLRTDSNAASDTADMLHGRLLPNNILTAALSPDGRSVFYITSTDSGSAGYIESVEAGVSRKVWVSPLRDLTASWNTLNEILVYNNPSAIAMGVVWSINPRTEHTSRILGPDYALAALDDHEGNYVLYSLLESRADIASLRVENKETGAILHMPMATIIEKCVWGPSPSTYVYCAVPRNFDTKNYLEQWYQGTLSSDDTLWRFDAATGNSTFLLDPSKETKTVFDITNLVVSPQEDYLLFRERKTDLIWSLALPSDSADATSTPATQA